MVYIGIGTKKKKKKWLAQWVAIGVGWAKLCIQRGRFHFSKPTIGMEQTTSLTKGMVRPTPNCSLEVVKPIEFQRNS
jgi:hypothetical protein